MKVRIWFRPVNNGDGSASVKFFRTKEDAERDAAVYEINCGESDWAEDCISLVDLEFDENGTFLNPDEIETVWADEDS